MKSGAKFVLGGVVVRHRLFAIGGGYATGVVCGGTVSVGVAMSGESYMGGPLVVLQVW